MNLNQTFEITIFSYEFCIDGLLITFQKKSTVSTAKRLASDCLDNRYFTYYQWL